jgi:hypothetical protein
MNHRKGKRKGKGKGFLSLTGRDHGPTAVPSCLINTRRLFFIIEPAHSVNSQSQRPQASKPTSTVALGRVEVCRSTTDLIYAVPGVDWSEAGGKPKKGRKGRKRREEREEFIPGE